MTKGTKEVISWSFLLFQWSGDLWAEQSDSMELKLINVNTRWEPMAKTNSNFFIEKWSLTTNKEKTEFKQNKNQKFEYFVKIIDRNFPRLFDQVALLEVSINEKWKNLSAQVKKVYVISKNFYENLLVGSFSDYKTLADDLVLGYLHKHGFTEIRDDFLKALGRSPSQLSTKRKKAKKVECFPCKSLSTNYLCDWLVMKYLSSKPEFSEVSIDFMNFLMRDRFNVILKKCLI